MKQLLLALFCALPLTAMDLVVKKEGLFVPAKLGSLKVMRTNDGYEVLKNNARHKVHNYDVDPLLKKLDKKALGSFLASKAGYIEVSKFDNGDYKLQAKMRLNGGFLLTGVIVYNTLKYTGYAAYGIGSIGAIAASFVAAGPAGAAGTYAGALAALPTVAAGIESGSLMIGTAASFIPGLP